MTIENDQKPKLEEILGQQAVDLLNQAGIVNLHAEEDGTVSGEQNAIEGLPVTRIIENVKIEIVEGKITINGKVTKTDVNVGKII